MSAEALAGGEPNQGRDGPAVHRPSDSTGRGALQTVTRLRNAHLRTRVRAAMLPGGGGRRSVLSKLTLAVASQASTTMVGPRWAPPGRRLARRTGASAAARR
jgi:hypothetical protein